MSQPKSVGSASHLSPEDEETMAMYGITRVVTDCFHFGEYRYSSLRDAIAQAKRVAEAD